MTILKLKLIIKLRILQSGYHSRKPHQTKETLEVPSQRWSRYYTKNSHIETNLECIEGETREGEIRGAS